MLYLLWRFIEKYKGFYEINLSNCRWDDRMKLYVVRHGETVSNKMMKVSGDEEALLTNNGVRQAKLLQEEFKDITFDYVFSSPLSRAYETAKLITDNEVIIDKRLLERDYALNEGKLIADTNPKEIWNYHLNSEINGIEKVQDLFDRISKYLNDLKNRYDDKTILLVTHSGVARAIYYLINGIPLDGDLTKVELTNCGYQNYEI